jgi:uncharacterized cupredoxin-like copper-binding protein
MIRAKAQAISLAVTGILLSATAAFASDPTLVEVGMVNKQDGSQFMTLSRASVHSGPITFRVANHSANMVHEFLIVRTDLDPNAFPMKEDDQGVDEEKLAGIRELGDLKPGTSGGMEMALSPGRYVMFCNQPGHFKAGMFAILTVFP